MKNKRNKKRGELRNDVRFEGYPLFRATENKKNERKREKLEISELQERIHELENEKKRLEMRRRADSLTIKEQEEDLKSSYSEIGRLWLEKKSLEDNCDRIEERAEKIAKENRSLESMRDQSVANLQLIIKLINKAQKISTKNLEDLLETTQNHNYFDNNEIEEYDSSFL